MKGWIHIFCTALIGPAVALAAGPEANRTARDVCAAHQRLLNSNSAKKLGGDADSATRLLISLKDAIKREAAIDQANQKFYEAPPATEWPVTEGTDSVVSRFRSGAHLPDVGKRSTKYFEALTQKVDAMLRHLSERTSETPLRIVTPKDP